MGAQEEVATDDQKTEAVESKLQQSTSLEQVDSLTEKLDCAKAKSKRAAAQLQKAVSNVEEAGVSQILSGVKAGVITGTQAVEETKRIELKKTSDEIQLSADAVNKLKARVQAATAKRAELLASIAK